MARADMLWYRSTVSSSGLLLHRELPLHPVTLLRNTTLRTRHAIWSEGGAKVRRMHEQKKPPKRDWEGAFLMTLWMTAVLLTLKQTVRSKQRKYNLTFTQFRQSRSCVKLLIIKDVSWKETFGGFSINFTMMQTVIEKMHLPETSHFRKNSDISAQKGF